MYTIFLTIQIYYTYIYRIDKMSNNKIYNSEKKIYNHYNTNYSL